MIYNQAKLGWIFQPQAETVVVREITKYILLTRDYLKCVYNQRQTPYRLTFKRFEGWERVFWICLNLV